MNESRLFRAGELMRCPSCRSGVSVVSASTHASVRIVADSPGGVPGSVVHQCRRCRAHLEILPLPEQRAA